MKVIEVIKLDSIYDKSLGVHRYPDIPILFRTRLGIHTFGLSKPLYVYILTFKMGVFTVEVVKKLYPNKIFFWNPKYNFVLENYKDLNLQKREEIKIKTISSMDSSS